MRDAVLKVRLSGVQPSSQPAGASICLAPQPPAAGRHFMGVPCQRPLFSASRPPQRRTAAKTPELASILLFDDGNPGTPIFDPRFCSLRKRTRGLHSCPVLPRSSIDVQRAELSTPTLLIDATLAWPLRQSTLTITLPEWLEIFQTPTTKRPDLTRCTTADRRGMATQNHHHGSAV